MNILVFPFLAIAIFQVSSAPMTFNEPSPMFAYLNFLKNRNNGFLPMREKTIEKPALNIFSMMNENEADEKNKPIKPIEAALFDASNENNEIPVPTVEKIVLVPDVKESDRENGPITIVSSENDASSIPSLMDALNTAIRNDEPTADTSTDPHQVPEEIAQKTEAKNKPVVETKDDSTMEITGKSKENNEMVIPFINEMEQENFENVKMEKRNVVPATSFFDNLLKSLVDGKSSKRHRDSHSKSKRHSPSKLIEIELNGEISKPQPHENMFSQLPFFSNQHENSINFDDNVKFYNDDDNYMESDDSELEIELAIEPVNQYPIVKPHHSSMLQQFMQILNSLPSMESSLRSVPSIFGFGRPVPEPRTPKIVIKTETTTTYSII